MSFGIKEDHCAEEEVQVGGDRRQDNAAFGDTVGIDLSATSGDVIAVTLQTSVVAKSYAGHYPFDNAGQDTHGSAYASFNNFDFAFATEEAQSAVPLPAALALFATGLGALGLIGWRRKRKAAALAA